MRRSVRAQLAVDVVCHSLKFRSELSSGYWRKRTSTRLYDNSIDAIGLTTSLLMLTRNDTQQKKNTKKYAP